MKYVETPPFAPTLMESSRAIGYSVESAIADIIDNSISANASFIDINFFPVGKTYIAILDNGDGMIEDELIKSMKFGSRNPLEYRADNDLGRYGLGMKTASLSQCRVLSVLSKKKGVISGVQWNLDHINQIGTWSLIVLEKSDIEVMPCFESLKKIETGTLIIWQDLDRFILGERNLEEAFSRKMNSVREHISLVFHRYLSGEVNLKKLVMRMNGRIIESHDPFLINKSIQYMDEENIIVRNEKIKVKPYILPHISKLSNDEIKKLGGKEGLQRSQGFYIYRNKRLLIWGTWFNLIRKDELSKLARVQVDIPNSLDDLWTLDIKKSTAVPPDEVKKQLAVIINNISNGSKRTWLYRGRKETSDDVSHIWNRMVSREQEIFYEVNMDHILISSIIKSYPSMETQLKSLLKQISLMLPLNSIYTDLHKDIKINNECDININDVLNLVKNVLFTLKNKEEKDEVFDLLLLSEPFSFYVEELRLLKERGELDD